MRRRVHGAGPSPPLLATSDKSFMLYAYAAGLLGESDDGWRYIHNGERTDFAHWKIPSVLLSQKVRGRKKMKEKEESVGELSASSCIIFRSYLPTHDFPAVATAKNSYVLLHTDRRARPRYIPFEPANTGNAQNLIERIPSRDVLRWRLFFFPSLFSFSRSLLPNAIFLSGNFVSIRYSAGN